MVMPDTADGVAVVVAAFRATKEDDEIDVGRTEKASVLERVRAAVTTAAVYRTMITRNVKKEGKKGKNISLPLSKQN